MTTIRFITGLLTFYMKGEISKDDSFIYLVMPDSILGFIPLSKTCKQLLLNQVASISTGFQLVFKDIFVGIAEMMLGMLFWQFPFIALLLAALGIITVIGALQTTLTVNLTSGEHIVIRIHIFEGQKVCEAHSIIYEAINNCRNNTNNHKIAEWQTGKY